MNYCLRCDHGIREPDASARTCKTCRTHPRKYYYEKRLRETFKLPKRSNGGQNKDWIKDHKQGTPEHMFEVLRKYLPFQIYWDPAVDMLNMTVAQLEEEYQRRLGISTEPYRLVRLYYAPHDYPRQE